MLRAQLAARPRDLELLARHFRKDENAVPPTFLLQAPGGGEPRRPEEPGLGSVLCAAAQDALQQGLISLEQCGRFQCSGEAVGSTHSLGESRDMSGVSVPNATCLGLLRPPNDPQTLHPPQPQCPETRL